MPKFICKHSFLEWTYVILVGFFDYHENAFKNSIELCEFAVSMLWTCIYIACFVQNNIVLICFKHDNSPIGAVKCFEELVNYS